MISAMRAFVALISLVAAASEPVTFAIIGDRTGNAQPGVYQHVWREVDKFSPDFAINTGDTIQGGNDATTESEWKEFEPLLKRKLPFYLVPGNHDIFSERSEREWRKVTGRAPSYSFDFKGVHIAVLDNSRATELSSDQLDFLEADMAKAQTARARLVFFHSPFWLTSVLFRNPSFRLHRIATRYRIGAVVCGHVHRFGYWRLDGVQYLMVGSSGGQLRGGRFAEGWFFQWIEARVEGEAISFTVHELPPPDGEGRAFAADEWRSTK